MQVNVDTEYTTIDPTMSRLRAQLKELKDSGHAGRKVFRSNSLPSPPTAMEADASLTSRRRTRRVLSLYSLPSIDTSPREDAVEPTVSKEGHAHVLTTVKTFKDSRQAGRKVFRLSLIHI